MPRRFKMVRRKKIWRSRMILYSGVFIFSIGLILGSVFIVPGLKSSLHGAAESKASVRNKSENPFKDVLMSDPNISAIKMLKERGVITGYEDSTFKPGEVIKRSQLVKMVVAANNAEPHEITNSYCFDDVQNQWYARYVCFAKTKGWVSGFDGNQFKPDDNITKAEAISIATKSMRLPDDALTDDELAGGVPMESEITRGQACDILARTIFKAGM